MTKIFEPTYKVTANVVHHLTKEDGHKVRLVLPVVRYFEHEVDAVDYKHYLSLMDVNGGDTCLGYDRRILIEKVET